MRLLLLFCGALASLCQAASVHRSLRLSLSKRIIGGYPVRRGDSPFLVSLQKFNAMTRKSTHFCGASVITNQFLLTAAHCIDDKINSPEMIKAYLGTLRSGANSSHVNHTHQEDADEFRERTDLTIQDILYGNGTTSRSTTESPFPDYGSDRSKRQDDYESYSYYSTTEMEYESCIEKVFMNKGYDPESTVNDIALLKLAMPIPDKYYSRVVPTSLPTKQMQRANWPQTGMNCTVFGWGLSHVPQTSSEWAQEEIEEEAKRVDVVIQPPNVCERFNKFITRDQNSTLNHEAIFCAGNIGSSSYGGAFSGDSGGPLICGYAGRYYQAGIVSYGSYEIGAYIPAFYARVTAFEDWIKKTIKDN